MHTVYTHTQNAVSEKVKNQQKKGKIRTMWVSAVPRNEHYMRILQAAC